MVNKVLILVITTLVLIGIFLILSNDKSIIEEVNNEEYTPKFMTNGEWKHIVFETKPIEEVLLDGDITTSETTD